MKITVLNDNSPSAVCGSEHGLSYVVEADQTILFDAGPSDIFLKNAEILGINLDLINTVVLSHGHWDHGNGLMYLENKTLITHPNSFAKRYRKANKTPLGLPFSLAEAQKKFLLKLTSRPLWVSADILYLGEIPRLNDFEGQVVGYELADGTNDDIWDDSAIVVRKANREWVVVTACSHSGVCNIVSYAQTLVEGTISAVVGGFHLKKADSKTARTIECLKNKQIQQVIPSHCTTFEALFEFRKHFEFQQVQSGNVLVF